MKFSRLLLFTLVFLLAWSFISPKQDVASLDDIILETDEKVAVGKDVVINIENRSELSLSLPSNCPKNPLIVEQYLNGEWKVLEAETDDTNCKSQEIVINPGDTYILSYAPWNRELFTEEGRYRVTLTTTIDEKDKVYTKEITVTKSGIFRLIWTEAFYKPILNTLVFLISTMAGSDLGWGIILLTILIKLLLLAPNHKALKAQKAMQKVQPQLDALKKKYKDSPQKLAEETMLIWKKYKVSPMSSCLPMLIQFPVLIALFYVVKDGLHFTHPELLYPSLQGFDLTSINNIFLGIIDLGEVNILVLPIIIGLLQFGQMKLTLGKAVKGQDQSGPNLMMNKTMMYAMPVMIAVFTASMPAAVGFYWGTSTLFGIGQQIFVNKSKD